MSDFKTFWDSLKDFENSYTSHYRTEFERVLNKKLDLDDWKIIFVSKDETCPPE